MRNFIVFLLFTFFSLSASAETQTVKQSRLRYDLAMGGFQASRATRLITYFGNTLYYDTAVELLAATPSEGVFAWAIDTNVMYFYTGAAWVALGSASGILGTNGGTIGNETNNVWTIAENSEDLTLTYSSNLVTFASGTSATLAFTPASAFAGDVTLNGGAGALTFGAASSSVVVPDASATGLVMGSAGRLDLFGLDTQDGVEKVIIKGTTTQDALHVDIGTVQFDEDLAVTGDVVFSGGASALTLDAASSSIVVLDNSATGLVIGSTDRLDLLGLDTQDGVEKVIVKGTTTQDAFHVDIGDVQLDEDLAVTGDITVSGGASGLTFDAASSSIVVPDNSSTGLVLGSTDRLDLLGLDTQDGVEKVIVKGTTTQDAFHVDIGDVQLDEDLAVTGDATISGGVGALTFDAASSSVVVPDNSATGLVMGSTDRLDLLGLDTQDGTEKVIIKGTTTQDALHVDIGDVQFDEDLDVTGAVAAGSASITGTADVGALTVTSPAIMLHEIRFCGNGMDGATAHYMGPVALDDTEADLAVGGAGCDALDDATIGNVDAAVDMATNFAFKPVAMACSGICTGATAANDTVTFLLYDDTVSVADVTCNFTFVGDATANQCTVTDTSPATIAAGSLLAVSVAGTDDACSDAGDDFECFLYVTF